MSQIISAIARVIFTDNNISAAPIRDASANKTVCKISTTTSVTALAVCISFWAIRPAKSFSKKGIEWPMHQRWILDNTRLKIFGVTITDCIYEEHPKIIGRTNKKNINPAENKKTLFPSGLSTLEFRAASINKPNSKTADTSVIPVKIDNIPERESILKLPDKDHFKKLNVLFGGGPLAGSKWFIQLNGFTHIA